MNCMVASPVGLARFSSMLALMLTLAMARPASAAEGKDSHPNGQATATTGRARPTVGERVNKLVFGCPQISGSWRFKARVALRRIPGVPAMQRTIARVADNLRDASHGPVAGKLLRTRWRHGSTAAPEVAQVRAWMETLLRGDPKRGILPDTPNFVLAAVEPQPGLKIRSEQQLYTKESGMARSSSGAPDVVYVSGAREGQQVEIKLLLPTSAHFGVPAEDVAPSARNTVKVAHLGEQRPKTHEALRAAQSRGELLVDGAHSRGQIVTPIDAKLKLRKGWSVMTFDPRPGQTLGPTADPHGRSLLIYVE